MTPTLLDGLLAVDAPKTAHYPGDGPGHEVVLTRFPRRIRAVVGGNRCWTPPAPCSCTRRRTCPCCTC